MPDKSLAERVAERLRRTYAPNFEPVRSDVMPLLADFVEAANKVRNHWYYWHGDRSTHVPEHDAALRRLAVALGVEEGE